MTRSTLNVTTPAMKRWLTTLARLQQDIPLTGDEGQAALEQLIESASAAIAAYVNQRSDGAALLTLGRETLSESWRDVYQCGPLIAARAPIASLVSVEEDGVLIEAVVDDEPNPDFVYEFERASGFIWKLAAGDRTSWSARKVTIAYEAGWLLPHEQARNLPFDIEDACILLCKRRLQLMKEGSGDYDSLQSESIPGLGAWTFALEKVTWEKGISSDVAAMIERYRRHVV
ncbi:MAG: hypothetical protein AB7P23_01795 [Amphiplicatus sp.]